MSKTIGIDLGTTNTSVAAIIGGRPKVLEDEKGYKVLPSCVSAKGGGRYIIGQAAKNLILSSPDRTVYAVKRLIGRRFDSPEVQRARQRMGYRIDEAPAGGVQVRIGEEVLTPVEVSSIILQVAREIAERALEDAVEEAVVTVPAYFTHAQREATLQAARLAGLKCERLLNEPTAAALAYGFRKDVDRTLVIFDLGGGTFDVCVLRLSSGVYEILATSGDSYLGGEDFDFRLVDHLADHFQSQQGVDLREDRVALQRLKDAAERAKCELSFTDRTTVLVPRIMATANLEMVVSRQTLESLVDDLVARCIDLTRKTVGEAGLQLGQVDDVVLVGGQTRMPKVKQVVTDLFGREPSRSVHPEEAVAVGAAIHANALADTSVVAPLLLDVTPFDLGIDSVGGLFSPIIGRNSKIPVSRMRTFATIHDNQDRVRIVVRQGDGAKADENEFLGEFVMEGLTPMPRMECKVEVNFRLDANGMLHVQAVEQGTGEKKQITIRNYAEVAASRSESERPVSPDVEAAAPSEGAPATGGAQLAEVGVEDLDQVDDVVPLEDASRPAPAAPARKSGILSSLLQKFKKGKPATVAAPAPGGDAPTEVEPEPVELEEVEPAEDGVLVGDGADEPRPAAVKDVQIVGRTGGVPTIGDLPSPGRPSDIRIDLPRMAPARGDGADEVLALDEADAGTTLDDEPVTQGRRATIGLAGEGGDVDDLIPLGEEVWDREPGVTLGAPPHETLVPDDLLAGAPMHPRMDDDFGIQDLSHAADSLTPIEEEPASPWAPAGRPTSGMASSSTARLGPALPAPDDDDLIPLSPAPEPPRSPGVGDDAEDRKRKKPARLKMAYRTSEAFVLEYRENLRRGGTFIRTPKPLPVGRECLFEVQAPGLPEPLTFTGVVTWSSREGAGVGQEEGMGIEYRMTEQVRAEIGSILDRLSR